MALARSVQTACFAPALLVINDHRRRSWAHVLRRMCNGCFAREKTQLFAVHLARAPPCASVQMQCADVPALPLCLFPRHSQHDQPEYKKTFVNADGTNKGLKACKADGACDVNAMAPNATALAAGRRRFY